MSRFTLIIQPRATQWKRWVLCLAYSRRLLMLIVGEDGIGLTWRKGVLHPRLMMMRFCSWIFKVSLLCFFELYCISMYRRIILRTTLDIWTRKSLHCSACSAFRVQTWCLNSSRSLKKKPYHWIIARTRFHQPPSKGMFPPSALLSFSWPPLQLKSRQKTYKKTFYIQVL